MKRNSAIDLMKTAARISTRGLSALAAAALLAALAPASAHAGDDGTTTTKHAKRHLAARVRDAHHLHYLSEPRVNVEGNSPATIKRTNTDSDDNKPLDQSLYRSYQENNLLNPG